MERKICKRCGNYFTTKGENTMCQYCISTVLADIMPRVPARKKSKPQVLIDAIAAAKAGLSYGYYMAWKEGRR